MIQALINRVVTDFRHLRDLNEFDLRVKLNALVDEEFSRFIKDQEDVKFKASVAPKPPVLVQTAPDPLPVAVVAIPESVAPVETPQLAQVDLASIDLGEAPALPHPLNVAESENGS